MQIVVMIRDKSITDVVAKKYLVTGDEAIYAFQHKVLVRRLVRNMAQAVAKYETAEKAQWKDGDVVGRFSDNQRWGKLDIKHFLIVKCIGRSQDYDYLTESISEMPSDSQLKGIPWEERPFMATIKRRASYRFEYWNYLDANETEKVRDMDRLHQPLLHIPITVRDLVYNG